MRWSLPLFPFILVIFEILCYLSNDMYLPALPAMMNDLNLTVIQAQWSLTIYMLGISLMPIVAGPLSDRFGRRNTILTGGACYILTNLICFYTMDAYLFLITRFFQGVAVAFIVNSAYAAVHESFDQVKALHILAIMGAIVIIAPGLGPLLGAISLSFTTWRGIFLLIALCSLGVWAAIYRIMPETLLLHHRKSLHVFELCSSYFRILSNPVFLMYGVVLGLIFGGFLTWVFTGPLLLIESFHHTPLYFGMLQAGVFLVYIIGLETIKLLLKKEKNIYFISRLGILIVAGASISMLAVYFAPTSLFAFVIPLTLYSFGSGLCFPPLGRLLIESSDEPMGMRVACNSLIVTGIGTLCTFLSSLIFNGNTTSLALMIGISGLTAVVLYEIFQKRRA